MTKNIMVNDIPGKKIYGLLGRNISYSLSPAMHNAAFKHFKINAEYTIFDRKEDELGVFFEKELLGGKISGINVTVPYKIKMKEMLEEGEGHTLDAQVRLFGALNTIKVDGRALSGFNTDAAGFYRSLSEVISPRMELKGKDVLVIGAGGAGRVISLFLRYFSGVDPYPRVYVTDADEAKLHFNIPGVELDGIHPILPGQVEDKIKNCKLVVNATPLGTKEGDPAPIPLEWLRPGMVVYDLVYARKTELLACAKRKGLKAVDGLGMLINQAALAFAIWNPEAPFGEIREVMTGALREKGLVPHR